MSREAPAGARAASAGSRSFNERNATEGSLAGSVGPCEVEGGGVGVRRRGAFFVHGATREGSAGILRVCSASIVREPRVVGAHRRGDPSFGRRRAFSEEKQIARVVSAWDVAFESRTALSMETTLLVYRCRSASVRSMVSTDGPPTRRPRRLTVTHRQVEKQRRRKTTTIFERDLSLSAHFIMAPEVRWPRVGVGVLIVRDGKVLIGQRKGSHGAGQYALPGGKLEWMETWETCARREVLEECAIDLNDVPVTYCYTTEAVIDEHNHWITVFMIAHVSSTTEARNEEPDKCEGWHWMAWDDVPTPRFLPLDNILRDAKFTPQGVDRT